MKRAVIAVSEKHLKGFILALLGFLFAFGFGFGVGCLAEHRHIQSACEPAPMATFAPELTPGTTYMLPGGGWLTIGSKDAGFELPDARPLEDAPPAELEPRDVRA